MQVRGSNVLHMSRHSGPGVLTADLRAPRAGSPLFALSRGHADHDAFPGDSMIPEDGPRVGLLSASTVRNVSAEQSGRRWA